AMDSLLPVACRIGSVILTHGHCDHAGNAAYFADAHGAKIVAHREEAAFVSTRRTYVPRGIGALGPKGWVFATGELAYPVKRRPVDTTVEDGDRIPSPIGDLRIVHTPGHTAGHIS